MPENLYVYFQDSPYSLKVGGVTKPCNFIECDGETLQTSGAGQIAAQAVATFATADFPALKGNDALEIVTAQPDGTTSTRGFSVWRRARIQDGALTEIALKRA